MVRRWLQGLVLLGLLGTIASAAQAETISRIRVMLHPYAAAPGVLPDAALARLQTLAGISLHLARTTRTGALELDLAQPLDRPTATALVARLRVDRSVLWAEPVSTQTLLQAQSAPRQRCDHRARRQADAAARRRSRARLVDPAAALERDRGRAARRRPPGRQRLGSEAAEQGRTGQPGYDGLAAADRSRRAVRRPGAPGHGQARAERPEIQPAMGVVRPRRRHRRAGRLGSRHRQRLDRRRGDRHRHHAASGAGRPRSARLRLHQRSGLGKRRQRSRQRRAPIPATAPRTANAATASPASRARGTAHSSAASSRPIPTTAPASPGSTGMRRFFRSACSANAAERSKTSPRESCGRSACRWAARRTTRIRRKSST